MFAVTWRIVISRSSVPCRSRHRPRPSGRLSCYEEPPPMNRHVASHRRPGRSGPASPQPVNQHRSPSWASRKYRRCTSGSSGRRTRCRGVPARGLGAGILFLLMPGIAFVQSPGTKQPDVFHLEEATIEEIHHAIQDGQISCRRLVQAYVDRAKTYNCICTQLVTSDGAPIAPASGPIRAGSALRFPTTTVPVSSVLPDSDQYGGIPLDLGRMEPAMSDPTVQAQFGMVVGIPNAGRCHSTSATRSTRETFRAWPTPSVHAGPTIPLQSPA